MRLNANGHRQHRFSPENPPPSILQRAGLRNLHTASETCETRATRKTSFFAETGKEQNSLQVSQRKVPSKSQLPAFTMSHSSHASHSSHRQFASRKAPPQAKPQPLPFASRKVPPVTPKLRDLTNHTTTRLTFNSFQSLSSEFPRYPHRISHSSRDLTPDSHSPTPFSDIARCFLNSSIGGSARLRFSGISSAVL